MCTCFRVPNGTKTPFCTIELLFFNGTEKIFGTVEWYKFGNGTENPFCTFKIVLHNGTERIFGIVVHCQDCYQTVQKGFLVPLNGMFFVINFVKVRPKLPSRCVVLGSWSIKSLAAVLWGGAD